MKIILLRHGKTLGNEKKRYVGRTDEPLSELGKVELKDTKRKIQTILKKESEGQGRILEHPFKIYVVSSPMLRCRETAKEIFSSLPKEPQEVFIPDGIEKTMAFWNIEEELRECDFGIFENKNYLELSTEPRYQQWIDSNGTMDFPEGESLQHFKERSVAAFCQHVKVAMEQGMDMAVFVVHGGSIMAILEAMDSQKLGYYDYSVKNGEFVLGEILTLLPHRLRLQSGYLPVLHKEPAE